MSPAILGALVFYTFIAWCFWRILTRVGYTPWPALLVFVPFIGQSVLIVWLAFGRWPLLQYLESSRRWPGEGPHGG